MGKLGVVVVFCLNYLPELVFNFACHRDSPLSFINLVAVFIFDVLLAERLVT